MERNDCVVVGGGIVGLVSSILLADRFRRVSVVEKTETLGGLCGSIADDQGNYFDHGTHIPSFTGSVPLDEVVFGTPEEIVENWTVLEFLKNGNYHNGEWNLSGPTIDLRTLPEELYARACAELILRHQGCDSVDLTTYLLETLGPTTTLQVLAPIVDKLYAVPPTELSLVFSVRYFGLSRVVAFSREVTNNLKALPAFDDKLGFHTEEDYRACLNGSLDGAYLYPRSGKGVGSWIGHLEKKAAAKGVEFITGDHVSSITQKQGCIRQLELDGHGVLPCDCLVWTAPTHMALRAAGLTTPKAELTFRTACIFHFAFDQPLRDTTSHYHWCWDSNFKTFRITLYPNLEPHLTRSRNNLTMEVLCSPEEAEGITTEDILCEVHELGFVSRDARCVSRMKKVEHSTFPVPTPAFNEYVTSCVGQLEESLSNIILLGRYSGRTWFMRDVLMEAWEVISSRFPVEHASGAGSR